MLWKIVLILGILGILLGLIVTGISAALPIVTDGKASWGEVAIPIVAGVVVFVLSFFVFLLGLIFVIKNRKKELPKGVHVKIDQFGP